MVPPSQAIVLRHSRQDRVTPKILFGNNSLEFLYVNNPYCFGSCSDKKTVVGTHFFLGYGIGENSSLVWNPDASKYLGFLAPFVLLSHLGFLFRRKIIGNVESVADFLGLKKKKRTKRGGSETKTWERIPQTQKTRLLTVFPLIMLATVAHVRSNKGLISIKLAAKISSNNKTCSKSTKSAYHFWTTSAIFWLFSGFSISVMGSSKWCSQNSITFLKTCALTLGKGISVGPSSSSSPFSSIIDLTSSDMLATGSLTGKASPSLEIYTPGEYKNKKYGVREEPEHTIRYDTPRYATAMRCHVGEIALECTMQYALVNETETNPYFLERSRRCRTQCPQEIQEASLERATQHFPVVT